MMGGLRAFAQSFAGKAVLVFLAFMLLGSGIVGSISLFTSSRVSSGIQADGQNINELEIAQEARGSFYQLGQTFEQFGQQLDSQEAFERLGFMDQVRDATQARLVNEVAFKAQADQLNITTSQTDLSATIQETFTDPVTGLFSERSMARTLAANGLTERAYLRDVSEEFASNRLFNAADDLILDDETGLKIADVPQSGLMAQFNAAWGRYDLSYFAISGSGIDIAAPNDDELQPIMDANPDDYQRPEYRDFVGIFLTPDDMIPTIEVTDEDIQATYDEYVARSELLTQWSLRQLFVDDGDAAQAVVDAVRGGATFEDAAAANEQSTPLDLGPRSYTYGRDAVNAAFTAVKEAGMLDPIADNDRFTLIEVYQVDTPEIVSLEDYRDEAINEIAAPQAAAVLSARFSELDSLIGTLSLEEAAAQVELPLITGSIAQSGPDARVEGVPGNTKVASEIFTAPVGQTGFRNSFGEEGLFMVRVDAVEEERPMTFEEARPTLTSAYNTQARADLLNALGETALSSISDQTSFIQYILDNGVELKKEDGKTKGELRRLALPIDVLEGTAAGDIVSGVTNTGFNIILVRDARAADPELDAEALEGIEFQLARQYDDELQRAYRAAVRETVNVNITEKVFERAITSGLNAYLDLRSGGTGEVRLEGVGAGAGGQTGAGI